MSEELNSLTRGATSLTLMMMGYDHELDDRLKKLRIVLKNKEFELADFKSAIEDVEQIYDGLETSTDKGIDTYKKAFEVLLDDPDSDILAPLMKDSPALSDLLKIAEPLARHVNTLSSAEQTNVSAENMEAMRSRLTRRFKSLLQMLMLMGNSSDYLKELDGMLSGKPSWDTLDQLASKTIELLKSRLNEEKKQFEGYLSELNAKLTRINEIVESDSETLKELKVINLEFNSSISQQMTEAREKIDQHDKVDVLKSDLLVSLDNITLRIEEYQTKYGSKLQSLQSNKVEMNQHVQELEKENQVLLAELHKERKLSMMDTLTQLPNRQGFNNRLDEELSRANRYNHYLSIAILDIDKFKRINDDFGHLVGDKVLRMIAKEMKRKCRESDYIARFGGEEFILLLPQTSLDDAVIAVDKLREHVANCPFHYQNKPVPLSLSGGVAERKADESTESWIDRADSALYESKNNGRNKVTAAH
jgi:diguanylate cyclase